VRFLLFFPLFSYEKFDFFDFAGFFRRKNRQLILLIGIGYSCSYNDSGSDK